MQAVLEWSSLARVAVVVGGSLALYYWWINSPLYQCLVSGSCFDVYPDGSVGAGTGAGTGSIDLPEVIRRIGEKLPDLTKQAVEAIAKACVAANLADFFVDVDTPCSGDLIRLYIPGGLDEEKTSEHIRDAIAGHPAWVKLTRKQPPAHPRGWLRAQPVCKQASAAGMWCDEYPFASTNEGGQANNPSLAPAPEAEQIVQRNTLGHFYLRQASCQPFPAGTAFAVIPVTEKFVPTVSICK
jgi:hypothetical protein